MTTVEFLFLVILCGETGLSRRESVLKIAQLFPEAEMSQYFLKKSPALKSGAGSPRHESDFWATEILNFSDPEAKTCFAFFAASVFTGDTYSEEMKLHLYWSQKSVAPESLLALPDSHAKFMNFLKEAYGFEALITNSYFDFINFVQPVEWSEKHLDEISLKAQIQSHATLPLALSALQDVFNADLPRYRFLARHFEYSSNHARLGLPISEAMSHMRGLSPKIDIWLDDLIDRHQP
jgi:hypothetical protein